MLGKGKKNRNTEAPFIDREIKGRGEKKGNVSYPSAQSARKGKKDCDCRSYGKKRTKDLFLPSSCQEERKGRDRHHVVVMQKKGGKRLLREAGMRGGDCGYTGALTDEEGRTS